ncbi:MAG: menaquinone biosynthetic enzyme MqnA/MqnD family protein [Armatimonadota bacterium]
MPPTYRIGAVQFSNARPLVATLAGDPRCDVTYDRPSRLSARLAHGEVDVALVPVADFLRGVGQAAVRGVSIASRGPAGSVLVLSKRPLSAISSLALDSGSRTSAALARIVLAQRYDCRPETVEAAPDLTQMLAIADAALLIGDAALKAMHPDVVAAIDLGQEWHEWQGVPFVYAVWAFAKIPGGEQLAELLRHARTEGVARLHDIARTEAQRIGLQPATIWRYYRLNMDYDLSPAHLEGLRRFGHLCARHGLIPEPRDPVLL